MFKDKDIHFKDTTSANDLTSQLVAYFTPMSFTPTLVSIGSNYSSKINKES